MKNNGKLYVNQDDPVLVEFVANYKNIYTYGSSSNANVHGTIADERESLLAIQWNGHLIKSRLVGNYNFMNIMSAIAIGVSFEVDDKDIVEAISSYEPDNNRSQIKIIGTNTLIMDAYNANPSSLKLAIENFGNSNQQNKMLIIGGMREMGDYSKRVHEEILSIIRKFKFDNIVLVGKEFEGMLPENEGLFFENNQAAKIWWKTAGIENHSILVKGSRGIALEKIFEA